MSGNPFTDGPKATRWVRPGEWITPERRAYLAENFPRDVPWDVMAPALEAMSDIPLPSKNTIMSFVCTTLKLTRTPEYRRNVMMTNLEMARAANPHKPPPKKKVSRAIAPVAVAIVTARPRYPARNFSMLGGKLFDNKRKTP